jgi:hypothetical protein
MRNQASRIVPNPDLNRTPAGAARNRPYGCPGRVRKRWSAPDRYQSHPDRHSALGGSELPPHGTRGPMALSVIARARPWGVRGRSSTPHHPNRCLHNKIRWCGGHRSTVAAAVLGRNPQLLCATSNSSRCAADKPAATLLHDVRSR